MSVNLSPGARWQRLPFVSGICNALTDALQKRPSEVYPKVCVLTYLYLHLKSSLLWFVVIFSAVFLGGCNHSQEEKEENEALYSGQKFSEHIRTTEARTPEEERQGFKLPEGFEIQLFASEPDIGKPLNIAFDARGRLWVTQSHEYPFPAEPGEGADHLSILEDTDGDGKADKFIHYEDTLNIPIGVLPIEDAAIAYSIPNLYRFTDNNGDDQADQSKVLFGEFGHTDTHGMVNHLTRGYDGWVYTCHGFTNTSTIAGTDGDSITMTSGNTFRFLPDGSRVERNTYGQVNPFGLAFDKWGYMYSTDCHTSPLYQLIRGADYPHFGKKEIGIGFAPDTKPMGEESTALAGLVLYDASQFPEEYQNNFYIGDVVTCRIHRNSYEFKGSTPVAKAEEDLVKSADPWFRPVDIKLGPDGALYVADFYNAIIGHYEVPLDHPKRDKVSGRIWRITYTGADKNTEDTNLADDAVEELIAALSHDNIAVRMMAANQLADQIGKEAITPLKQLLSDESTEARPYTLALWVLYRLNALDEGIMRQAATHADPVVSTHAMRVLREMDDQGEKYYPLITTALNDDDPNVQRAAVEAITNYPSMETIELLLGQKEKVPDYDTHYLYTLRLMLRNLMRDEEMMHMVAAKDWDEQQTETVADVLTGVENTDAGLFLYDYLSSTDADEKLPLNLQHAVRFVPSNRIAEVIRLGREKSGEDIDLSFSIFKAMQEGLVQRGSANQKAMQQWGGQLAENLFNAYLPGQSTPEVPDTAKIAAEDAEKLKLAVDLAGNYKLTALAPKMKTVLQASVDDPAVKVAAAQALLTIAPEENALLVQDLLQDENQPMDLKRRLITMLGEMDASTTVNVLAEVDNLPPDLQKDMALALASSPQGRDILFQKVQGGEVYARALVDPKVKERILLNISDAQLSAFEKLTANVPAVTEERNELIAERLANFTNADSLVQSGVMVFNNNCKTCHRVTNEGGMIGPQLTGIGNWGAEALATKILDPNRNISEAFRTYTIKTNDGQVKTGLYRREEGEALVFANMSGEEFSVAKSNIAEQEPSQYTLMPDHFGEVLPQEDFNALLSYLLNQQ